MSRTYNVLDIFAGAGGLSLGFQQIGRFKIPAAFENNEAAKETYAFNHESTTLYEDVLGVDFAELKEKFGSFDLIIGGPPCQGFSNANRQNNQLINMNNKLVRTFVEFVQELSPKVFLMENVKMLGSPTHRFFLSCEDSEEVLGYKSCKEEDLFICNNCEQIPFEDLCSGNVLNWPLIEMLPTYHIALRAVKRKTGRHDIAPGEDINVLLDLIQRFCTTLEMDSVKEAVRLFLADLELYPITLKSQEALTSIAEGIIRLDDISRNKIKLHKMYRNDGQLFIKTHSYTVIDYLRAELGKEYQVSDKVLNAVDYGAPQNRERFIMVGIRMDLKDSFEFPKTLKKKATVKDALFDLYDLPCSDSDMEYTVGINKSITKNSLDSLRDSSVIYNHICTKSTALALQRFEHIKQGENFHSLDPNLIKSYSNPSRTQNSIYLRLDETRPSATVTNVRKSMWIHPIHNRAVSVREAARLQTFPDSFQFKGTKDQQYQQVGNAVPPILAKALAKAICDVLDKG